VTTAAVAVALVQCDNAAGDMASKRKQRERQPVKRQIKFEKHSDREKPDKKPSLTKKESYFSSVTTICVRKKIQ
jgi:Ni/Co efflux regulator RcnB